MAFLAKLGTTTFQISSRGQRYAQSILVTVSPEGVYTDVREGKVYVIGIDESWSMKGENPKRQDRLTPVKKAVADLAAKMNPAIDTMYVFSFAKRVRPVVNSSNSNEVLLGLQSITGASNTNVKGALSEFARIGYDGRPVYRFLITDGNDTDNEEEDILAVADELGTMGYSVKPIGIGDDYNQTLLDQIGLRTGGRVSTYLNHPEVLSAMMRNISSQTIALQNVKVVLTVPPISDAKPEIEEVYKIIGTEVGGFDGNFSLVDSKTFSFNLGNIATTETVRLLFVMSQTLPEEEEDYPFGTISLSVQDQEIDSVELSYVGAELEEEDLIVDSEVDEYINLCGAAALLAAAADSYQKTGRAEIPDEIIPYLDVKGQALAYKVNQGTASSTEARELHDHATSDIQLPNDLG